ncbi:SDR family oxidoreductase [Enterovirga aerilata]|uniref:SDR family oxidoreductase n=1 Tax=Enterovirga aerilata TaxID=2730920 RepID=UPI003211CEBD
MLVTAGASGIGLAIVRAFAEAGASVFTCDIDQPALERVRAEIPGLHTTVCDVGDRAAVGEMVADAAARLGGIDVLVNNAGIAGPTSPVQDVDPDEWEAVLRVDLTGAFLVAKHAIPHLIRAGGGTIINMASAAGRFGYANRSPYAAAKWGLIGLTKTLSMELGQHGICVNAIAPGAVDGERIRRVFEGRAQLSGRSPDEEMQGALAHQSVKRLAQASEIAALALFLASPAARSISGQVIPVDGDQQRN